MARGGLESVSIQPRSLTHFLTHSHICFYFTFIIQLFMNIQNVGFSGKIVLAVGTRRKGGKVLISACAGATGGVVFHQNGGKNPNEKN